MKKVTLLFAILILSVLASGAYAYTAGTFDEILGLEDEDDNHANPLFFAGISKYKDSIEYSNYLTSIASNDEKIYRLFGNQVFALGKVNLYKFKHMNRAIICFIIAISSELTIIITMAWARAFPFLVQKFPNLIDIIN